MLVDAEGNAPKWWQKLLIGIGLFIVGAAITFFTAGAGAAGLAALGTFAIGFGKATAIGMAISGTIGAISGGISGGVQGALDGFGNAASDAFMFGGLGAAISSVGNGILAVSASRYNAAVTTIAANGGKVSDILPNFRGVPRVKFVNANTKVYRVYGGSAEPISKWVSPNIYNNPIKSLALDPSWGNTASQLSVLLFTENAVVLAGRAARQGSLIGGGKQWFVFFKDVLKIK